MKFFIFLFCIFLTACDPIRIASDDPFVSRNGRVVFYKGEKFHGLLESKFEELEIIRITSYKNGLPDGAEKEIHSNGKVLAEREFSEGKKVGTHLGWFVDGKKRFHNEYLDGQFHGSQWEWRNSGSLYSYSKFDHGKVIGKKMWRENGQIYMNFVIHQGRAYGMTGGKLCSQVRGDQDGNTIQF
ncbi:toxin-antitoxin system YwqK family antitoxin [Leptospira sarikeiensis]|uniref:Toxin-antitoxin system YwqK family antitoxin n=1 Tax=Leptospira sarikeiensis TaxID=2484943 RepID=A0A4R9KH93_9LEPT|nr:hypothetical protein [Leptospira sarikeiensis]TGL65780.1 hypothetical protein EHQ64_00455 [Leptospira sarikeiensis]